MLNPKHAATMEQYVNHQKGLGSPHVLYLMRAYQMPAYFVGSGSEHITGVRQSPHSSGDDVCIFLLPDADKLS